MVPTHTWSIGVMIFSTIGIAATLSVIVVFAINNDTPVVRASGRELSYVHLTGLILCYAMTYLLVQRPTNKICGAQQFGIGLSFAIVYGSLLTKTSRIARIFNAGKRTTTKLRFISPKSQFIICSMLVGVQAVVMTVWLLFSPPTAIKHYPTREEHQLVCAAYTNVSYMVAFTYPIILIISCTFFAIITRKIPEAFNESKFIGFTMYTTCVIWLAFVPIYFSTGHHVLLRVTTLCVTISLSSTVALLCLFTPKLKIILLRPSQNVRKSLMKRKQLSTITETRSTNLQTKQESQVAPGEAWGFCFPI